MESTVYNCDCLEYMKGLPDKAFALAIADPPYGGAGNEQFEGGADLVNASAATSRQAHQAQQHQSERPHVQVSQKYPPPPPNSNSTMQQEDDLSDTKEPG